LAHPAQFTTPGGLSFGSEKPRQHSIVGVTLSGGLLEIKSGGTAGSSTSTISSGTLLLDDSQHFSGTVAGLADPTQVMDLADINFAALHPLQYSSSTGSGTLTVTDGVHTAQLALLGTYAVGNFKTAADGHGGTLITRSTGRQQRSSHLAPWLIGRLG
jgi:hypothetical protein